MKRVVFVLLLTFAGLIPLLRYDPGVTLSPTQADPLPAAAAPPANGAPPATGAPTPNGAPAAGQKTVDGPVVDTEFGPYQVRVVFTGGKITDVRIITEPGDRHSRRIATSAAPTLREEALQAQSARIDTVSGATATSEAYAQSLQGAIDNRGN
jgi:uncharacterized protein with FMN-binding domain